MWWKWAVLFDFQILVKYLKVQIGKVAKGTLKGIKTPSCLRIEMDITHNHL